MLHTCQVLDACQWIGCHAGCTVQVACKTGCSFVVVTDQAGCKTADWCHINLGNLEPPVPYRRACRVNLWDMYIL